MRSEQKIGLVTIMASYSHTQTINRKTSQFENLINDDDETSLATCFSKCFFGFFFRLFYFKSVSLQENGRRRGIIRMGIEQRDATWGL